MRWFNLAWILLIAGCSHSRTITFNAQPPDATISIDNGPPRPEGFTEKIKFADSDDTHTVTASLSGYQDQTIILKRDDEAKSVDITLARVSRHITLNVIPGPAIITIDGTPVSQTPLGSYSKELVFSKDAGDKWIPYVVTAQRPGFATAHVEINYTDPSSLYVLKLPPLQKDLSITTTPPGATVTIDGETLGISPVVDKGRAFAFNPETNQFMVRTLRITKPGFDPYETTISWDEGKTAYNIVIPPKTKEIYFLTEPAGATASIDGHTLDFNAMGQPSMRLSFPPIDDKGTLPTYTATISKKTAETEWYPTTMPIGWDGGKSDYSATLKEVTSKPISMTSVALERNSDGLWEVLPRETQTLAMKNPGEPGREPPVRIYAAPQDATINTLAISPDGSQILFTILTGHSKSDFHSQILTVNTDGTGGTQQLTNGKSLDIYPSYTPDGDAIVFASNRAGKHLNIWQKPISGDSGLSELTTGDEEDLWPMIDAGPKPRLFYEARFDSGPDAQLYTAPVGTSVRTNLTTFPASQPRISPKADSIVFTSVNEKTGNREIYKISDKGGDPVNLTNDPDSDCYDPVWSKDGNMIAYVSNRGMDENRHHNPDIWILDLSHPQKPVQVTTNGSVDDCPAWDPTGNFIYFRSNRGTAWGIWKIAAK